MIHPVSFRRHVLRVKEREGLSFGETTDPVFGGDCLGEVLVQTFGAQALHAQKAP